METADAAAPTQAADAIPAAVTAAVPAGAAAIMDAKVPVPMTTADVTARWTEMTDAAMSRRYALCRRRRLWLRLPRGRPVLLMKTVDVIRRTIPRSRPACKARLRPNVPFLAGLL